MQLNLTKGDKLNLTKADGRALTHICVGLNWGMITKKSLFGASTAKEPVDLDASVALFDANNQFLEKIYFGNLSSSDNAIKHSGDDTIGDDENDEFDNEVITIDLTRIKPNVDKIVVILNSYKKQDFATIPYAHLRIYEGTPERVDSVFAKFNIAAEAKFSGFVSMILGKLYKHKGEWKLETIGEPTKDQDLSATIATAQRLYI
ncbi:MAG: hypothetical protein RI894_1416 [Bacteroidota bacterium]|jgi:tellurium resistance protein TerZ